MALETIKIAELPSATQVVGDDYLVVEQPDKTKKGHRLSGYLRP